MPPKQQSKADLAKKQKVVEDKTFGLKNKNKSKNVQKYVQNLQQAVQPKPDASKVAAKKKKEEEKAREKELSDLFKIAISQPKVPVGNWLFSSSVFFFWLDYLFFLLFGICELYLDDIELGVGVDDCGQAYFDCYVIF